MMERLFVTLLNMSLTASWIVLAVALFRLIFRRAPKWILCLMWLLVGLRLIVPSFIESPTSLIPTAEPITMPSIANNEESFSQQMIESENVRIPGAQLVPEDAMLTELPDTEIEAKPELEQDKPSAIFWASVVWIVGMACMLAYCFISYARLYLQVRERIRVEKYTYICDRIATPFILGVFSPKIILPSGLSSEDKTYVLAHEHAHLKRRDHWWKPLGFILLTVYWFNPFMWLAYILLCRDIEGACDEKVIKELGEEKKKPYSQALINCSTPTKWIGACPIAFGEGKLRSRIIAILRYKNPTMVILLVCLLVGIVIAVVFMTDPVDLNDAQEMTNAFTDVTESEKGEELSEKPGSPDQIWGICYPMLEDSQHDYSSFNNKVAHQVRLRLEGLFGENPKLVDEYTKLDYTVTCMSEDLFSFYYEGYVTVENTAHPTKLKLGFTFDPRTGQRLYLRNFVSVTEDLADRVREAWYEQLSDEFRVVMDDLGHNAGVYSSLISCDSIDSTTSFYIENEQLYLIYGVEFAAGSYHTLCLNSIRTTDNLAIERHYLGSGSLVMKHSVCDATVYYVENQPNQKKCFLEVRLQNKTLTYEIGTFDIVALWNGTLYVGDLDGDQNDEIVVHLLVSVNGGSETQVFKLEQDRIVLWSDLEAMEIPLPESIYDSEGNYFASKDLTFRVSLQDCTVMDTNSDGNYEIVVKRLIYSPEMVRYIVEYVLDYDSDSGKLELIRISALEKLDNMSS